jgi:hypothetical protein
MAGEASLDTPPQFGGNVRTAFMTRPLRCRGNLGTRFSQVNFFMSLVLGVLGIGVEDADARKVQLAFRVGPVVRERIGRVVKTRHLEELDNALRHDILNPKLATSKVLYFAAPLTVERAISC